MANRSRPLSRKPISTQRTTWQHGRELLLISIWAVALLLFLALFSYHQQDGNGFYPHHAHRVFNAGGKVGALIADLFLQGFGILAYLLPFAIAYVAWLNFRFQQEKEQYWYWLAMRMAGSVLLLLATCALLSLFHKPAQLAYPLGGLLGNEINRLLLPFLNRIGTGFMMLSLAFIAIMVAGNFSWLATFKKMMAMVFLLSQLSKKACLLAYEKICIAAQSTYRALKERISSRKKPVLGPEKEKIGSVKKSKPIRQEPTVTMPVMEKTKTIAEAKPNVTIEPRVLTVAPSQRALKEKQGSLFSQNNGELPSIALLDPPEKTVTPQYSTAMLKEFSVQVETHLRDFGVDAQVVAVHPGPVITRYELQLAPGVKVNKITALAKDLARSLSVVSVRVVEVIPGKPVVGLEVPNEHREMVRLSEVIASEPYDNMKSPLALALGKDIAGHPVVANLAKMPHLLVAGTTGSGKSVCVNAMLMSLLYKASAKEVRMIMIDPKMLELSVYDGIPHLLTPVVTDMKEAANALRWCVAEMDRRYRLMAQLGVRNLAGYNTKVSDAIAQDKPIADPLFKPVSPEQTAPHLTTLPHIVVIVDEFADMMMVVGKKVEQLIARIAQKARAAGIHMILATQRPSVDVITGLIKANVPTRIAFQVSSKIDSRTILDQTGAEQLLGHGDMLYLPPGSGVPIRVHGAFVADHEVHRVVSELQKQGEPEYLDDILAIDYELDVNASVDDMGEGEGGDGEQDPLYDKAVQIVIETRRASISSIQRRLKIGYNRAARLVDSMEQAGLVSAMEHNGTREVLLPE